MSDEVGVPLTREELLNVNDMLDSLNRFLLRQRSVKARLHAYEKIGRIHTMIKWAPDMVRMELLQWNIAEQMNGIKSDIKAQYDKRRG